VVGFVEELVDFKRKDNRDPANFEDQNMIREYMLKLRRKLSKNVLKKGGNAIITYKQTVDHEGDKSKRIVLRGYGTAVFLEIDPIAS